MSDQPGPNPDADEAQSVDPYYEDEWYEDEIYGEETDDFAHVGDGEPDDMEDYSQIEQDCRLCMGPCGRCEEIAAELTPEEMENYANFWTSVFMSLCGTNPIPLELDDENSDPISS